MGDSEILIAIKTALESGGIDAAKSKLGELTKEMGSDKAATAAASAEMAAFQRTLGPTQAGLNGLAQIMRGNLREGLNGIASAARSATDSLGKVGLGIGSLIAGWNLGTMIDQTLGLSDKIANFLVPAIKSVGEGAEGARRRIQQMADERLDKLRGELEKLQAQFDELGSDEQRAKRRADQARKAASAERLAAAEGIADPAQRDAAKAAEKLRSADEQSQADIAFEQSRIERAKQEQAALAERKRGLETSIRTADLLVETAARRGDNVSLFKFRREANLLREKYGPEIESISKRERGLGQDIADAETAISAERSLTGARGATASAQDARAARERDLQAQLAAKAAELAQARAAMEAGAPGLAATAARERDEAAAARAAAQQFEQTGMAGGRRWSSRSHQGRQIAQDLQAQAAQQESEAVAAAQSLAATNQRLVAMLQSVAAEYETLQRQLKNAG